MAEDAAQEERLRHLRHAVAVRHRRQRDCARHRRELPDAHLPPQRAGDRAADHHDLSALRPQRSPDRDHRPRHAQARLLLPVTARQPPVRAGSWAQSRSPSARRRPRPITPPSAASWPNSAATAFPEAWLGRSRPAVGRRSHSQPDQSWRCRHDQAMSACARRFSPRALVRAARDGPRNACIPPMGRSSSIPRTTARTS